MFLNNQSEQSNIISREHDSEKYYLDYLVDVKVFHRRVYNNIKNKIVREFINTIQSGSKILDAGCGAGYTTAGFSDKYDLYGIDSQKSAIEYCSKTHKGKYDMGDLCNTPYENNYFDAIVSTDVIEHISKPEVCLSELSRILKPEGKIMITTANYNSPLWVIYENSYCRYFGGNCSAHLDKVHPSRFTGKKLRELSKKYLNVEKVTTFALGMVIVEYANKQ